jgi:hypothetical protein
MSDDNELVRRVRMRALILLVIVFVVGLLLGAAEERYRQQQMATTSSSQRHVYPGALARMDLSPAQRAVIDSLLDRERPRNEAIMQRVLPDLRAEADSLRAAIRTVLTPEQQRAFDREPHPHAGAPMGGASSSPSDPSR